MDVAQAALTHGLARSWKPIAQAWPHGDPARRSPGRNDHHEYQQQHHGAYEHHPMTTFHPDITSQATIDPRPPRRMRSRVDTAHTTASLARGNTDDPCT